MAQTALPNDIKNIELVKEKMKNRAKCKKCETIIESFHRHDYVECKCGEIAVDGGPDFMRALAFDFSNFVRLDDEGNEISVKYKNESETQAPQHDNVALTALETLKNLCEYYQRLDEQALKLPVTHYDLKHLLKLLHDLFL